MTVADSCFPPSSSGTEKHHRSNLSLISLIITQEGEVLVICILCVEFAKDSYQLPHRSFFNLSLNFLATQTHLNKQTCGNSLPPEREGRSGLDGIA